jgi:hypothetical protein
MKIAIDRSRLGSLPAREVRAVCSRCETVLFSINDAAGPPRPEKNLLKAARDLLRHTLAAKHPPCGNRKCAPFEVLVTLEVCP